MRPPRTHGRYPAAAAAATALSDGLRAESDMGAACAWQSVPEGPYGMVTGGRVQSPFVPPPASADASVVASPQAFVVPPQSGAEKAPETELPSVNVRETLPTTGPLT
jgi:hypothetical protein